MRACTRSFFHRLKIMHLSKRIKRERDDAIESVGGSIFTFGVVPSASGGGGESASSGKNALHGLFDGMEAKINSLVEARVKEIRENELRALELRSDEKLKQAVEERDALKKEKQQLEVRMSNITKARREFEEKHKAAVSALDARCAANRAMYAQDRSNLQEVHEAEIKQLQEQHAAQIDALKKQHDKDNEQSVSGFEAELRRIKDEQARKLERAKINYDRTLQQEIKRIKAEQAAFWQAKINEQSKVLQTRISNSDAERRIEEAEREMGRLRDKLIAKENYIALIEPVIQSIPSQMKRLTERLDNFPENVLRASECLDAIPEQVKKVSESVKAMPSQLQDMQVHMGNLSVGLRSFVEQSYRVQGMLEGARMATQQIVPAAYMMHQRRFDPA